MIGGAIFIPHAIEVDGAIIMLYDELNHRPASTAPDGGGTTAAAHASSDRSVMAGGELTLASLDLIWNASASITTRRSR